MLWGCDSPAQGSADGEMWYDRATYESSSFALIRHPLLYITKSVLSWYDVYKYARRTIPFDTVDPRYTDACEIYENWRGDDG